MSQFLDDALSQGLAEISQAVYIAQRLHRTGKSARAELLRIERAMTALRALGWLNKHSKAA